MWRHRWFALGIVAVIASCLEILGVGLIGHSSAPLSCRTLAVQSFHLGTTRDGLSA